MGDCHYRAYLQIISYKWTTFAFLVLFLKRILLYNKVYNCHFLKYKYKM